MVKYSVCCILALLLLLMVSGAAIAQQGGSAQPPPPDPAGGSAPGQPPGGMGPPGMEFPADVVIADAPSGDPVKKAIPIVWVVAGVLVVAAAIAWGVSRKKKA